MGKDFVRELLKEKNIDEIWMIARRKMRLERMEEEFCGRGRALPLVQPLPEHKEYGWQDVSALHFYVTH